MTHPNDSERWAQVARLAYQDQPLAVPPDLARRGVEAALAAGRRPAREPVDPVSTLVLAWGWRVAAVTALATAALLLVAPPPPHAPTRAPAAASAPLDAWWQSNLDVLHAVPSPASWLPAGAGKEG